MRKAQIENGVVTNVILVDPNDVPDWCVDWPEATEEADVGATYVNGVFNRPVSPKGPVPSLSFAQLMIGLVEAGWITEAEGDAWLEGRLPVAVTSSIAMLPQSKRFEAKARAIRPSVVQRDNELLALMAMQRGVSEDQMDTFFRTYAER